MAILKRTLPKMYGQKSNAVGAQTERFPFHVKRCGYLSEKSFSLGTSNNYSDYLMLYSLSGVMRFTKNKDTQYVPQNNVIVSACNAPLKFSGASRDWKFFYIVIGGSHAKLYYNMIRSKSCVFTNSPLSNVLDFFIELYELDFQDTLYTNMRASLLIHSIFFELYQISSSILDTKKITPVQETAVNLALKYIARNYAWDDLSADKICGEVGYSKYYFCKLFKDHSGMTVHQYVDEFRVDKSKELLTYSKLSINAIALSVGFKSRLTYSRCFERYTHITPTEYRKNF